MACFSNFKQYMDAHPIIRSYLYAFYNRKYSDGLKTLDQLKREFKLDLFLSQHVDDLYEKIRKEAIKQVCGKFASKFPRIIFMNFMECAKAILIVI